MQPRLLTAADLAEYLNVSTTTVRRMVARGDLPKPSKLGNVTRWDRAAVDRVLDAHFGAGGQYDDPDAVLRDLS